MKLIERAQAVSTMPAEREMYRAIIERDQSFTGIFVVAVKTTGVFCRPGCPAKAPRRENVEFFANSSQALHAGYRPCKRCRPMDGGTTAPDWVSELITNVDRNPAQRHTDADLRAMNIDPTRVRRYFKEHYGMTFQAYQRARRVGLAMTEVRRNGHVNGVGYQHGYQSDSGFRDAFARLFGSTPGRAVQTNESNHLLVKWIDTPLGALIAGANDEGLCLLEYVDRRGLERQLETMQRRLKCAVTPGDHAHLESIARELASYFEGELTEFRTPLYLNGSPFQVRVWQRLLEIPFGETLSYSQMATDIGRPGAQRAVGRANGENRIAIVIPCHRVVRSDGTLCGYGGGMWRKQWLLDHERKHSAV